MSALSDFKSALGDAMGKEDAVDSWKEGGEKGPNPGPQIQAQADAIAVAVKDYLRALVAQDRGDPVKIPWKFHNCE